MPRRCERASSWTTRAVAMLAGLLVLTACVPMAKRLEDRQTAVVAWRVIAEGRDQDAASELARAFFFGGDAAYYYRMWPGLFPAAGDIKKSYSPGEVQNISVRPQRQDKTGGIFTTLYVSDIPAYNYYVGFLQEYTRIGVIGPDRYSINITNYVDGRYEMSDATPKVEFRLGDLVYLGTFKVRIVTEENSVSGRDVIDIVTDYVPGDADADALSAELNVPRDRIRPVDLFAGYPAARAAFTKPYSSREQ